MNIRNMQDSFLKPRPWQLRETNKQKKNLHHRPASVTHPDGSEGECEGAKFSSVASPEWVAAAHANTNYRGGISAEVG